MSGKQTALITGASFGFGNELAKLFAKDGYNLILVARSEDKLKDLAEQLRQQYQIDVLVMAKDLFSPTAPNEIYQALKDADQVVDVLVNNAGFGTYGRFSEIEAENDMNLVQLNVATVTLMTKLFLKDMVARDSGRILNVASMAAFMSGPYMATYFASKAYVMSFTEAVAEEVQGSGVKIMALCPGVASTNFQATAKNEAAIIGGKFDSLMMTAEQVVSAGYKDFMNDKVISIPGLSNKATALMVRFIPRRLMTKGIKIFNSSKGL
ncbi:MAG: short-chain dehydrogenase [Gammaproteobacteria bacterium]|nr:MAG: short-chain dehydrogenase [Gammaproteobacteria bacterium]PCJ14294.1 MAG: short-chain dehydrogenase [Gammaproteobacteria bacterium]